jgi:putative peptidoglycan lipid II flippase
VTTTSAGTRLARNTAVMAGGTLLSRVTGFGRLAAMTAAFGVVETRLADAYNTANVLPNIVYELVLGGVLSSVLVPIFVASLRGDAGEHRRVVNTITTLAGAVLVIVVLVAVALARPLAQLLTAGSGADAAQVRVVTLLLRLFLPQVLFYGLTTIWTAYLNAQRRFGAPMVAPVANNLVVTGVVLAFGAAVGFQAVDLDALATTQIWLLGAGTTAGVVAMTLPLWPVARRVGWSWRPCWDWRHPLVRRVGRLGGWALVYVLVNQLGYLVVVVLANAVPGAGTYSAYSYAFVFFQLPHGIYAVSVVTALVPALADAAAGRDLDAFRAQLARGVRATLLLIVPAAVGLGVLAAPIVALLLEQGVFSPASTRLVARVLAVWVVGLPSFSLFQLLLRAHYALQDTRTPALVNVVAVAVNVAVNLAAFALLPPDWKVPGLALGHATAYTVGAVVFAVLLRRRLQGLEGAQTAATAWRVAAASTGMGIAAWGTAALLATSLGVDTFAAEAVQVGGAVAVGAVTYLALAAALRVPELSVLAARARRHGGKP